MKFGMRYAVIVAGVAVIGCFALPVRAQSAGAVQPVFACSLGKRSVSVTAVGNQLTYKFGTPANTELSITGSAEQKNVLYRTERYAGMEHQLRFVKGDYSYIVYNMEGNGRTGANAISGLIVMKGNDATAHMSCKRYAEFGTDFDYGTLPEDTEDYSAMAN